MSDEPERIPDTTAAKPRADFEAPPDRERRNPFFRWLMHLGLPMVVSIAVHVVLFGLMALKTWEVMAQREIEVGDYEAGLVESLDDRIDEAFQWNEEVTLETPEVEPIEELDLSDFSRVEAFDESVFDESSAALGEGEGDTLGIGEGRFQLLGTGSGAGEAGTGGFGSGFGGRGGQLGQAGIWDLKVKANKIVYVVDFSGSIIVAEEDLKRELKRSVSKLNPTQAFNVIIFFSEDERFKSESFAAKLQPATEDTRTQFFNWLESKAPQGQTRPLQSMKRALNMQPEVIFFFSDGLFEDSVVDEIAKANRASRTKIYCLLFDELVLQEGSSLPPKVREQARRLQRVADENDGKLKIVTGADLRR
ncbi:MAG: hypothetical protein ABIG44_04775 [Planctomycetota bacterium]